MAMELRAAKLRLAARRGSAGPRACEQLQRRLKRAAALAGTDRAQPQKIAGRRGFAAHATLCGNSPLSLYLFPCVVQTNIIRGPISGQQSDAMFATTEAMSACQFARVFVVRRYKAQGVCH